MRAEDWTVEQLQAAMVYGFCLVCKTPNEVRRTESTSADGRRTSVLTELVQPCDCTEEDVERFLRQSGEPMW